MVLKFVTEAAGLKDATRGQAELTKQTNALTQATERYNVVAAKQQRINSDLATTAFQNKKAPDPFKFTAQDAAEGQKRYDAMLKRAEGRRMVYEGRAAQQKRVDQLSWQSKDSDFLDPFTANAGKAAAATEKVGAAAAKATGHVSGLSRVVNRLGSAFGLSGIGGVAMGGFVAGASILVGILIKMVSVANELATQIRDVPIGNLVKQWEKIKEDTYEAGQATDAYFRSLQRILARPETEASKAAARLAMIKEVADYEEKTADHSHQMNLLRIQEAESQNLISHQEALRRKFQEDEAYELKKLALELKSLQTELDSKKELLEAQTGQAMDLGDQIKKASDTATAAGAKASLKRATYDRDLKHKEALEKQVADYDAQIADATASINATDKFTGATYGSKASQAASLHQYVKLWGTHGVPGAQDVPGLEDNRSKASDELGAFRSGLDKELKAAQDAEKADTLAKEAAQELKTQFDALTTSIAALRIEIPNLTNLTGRKAADITAEERDAHRKMVQERVASVAAKEAAKDIAPGGAGSILMWGTDKAKWDRTAPQNRGGMNPPQPYFNPSLVDPVSGMPYPAGQKLNQDQWNVRQYGNRAPGGAGNDYSQIPGELQPLAESISKETANLNKGIFTGFSSVHDELIDINRKIAEFNERMKDMRNN